MVEDLDDAFQDFSSRCYLAIARGGVVSFEEIKANETALYRVLGALDRLTASDYAASRATEARAVQLATTAVGVLSLFIGAAIGVSALVAWLTASSLLTPIKALTASATALGEGNLDISVREFSRDELGSLAPIASMHHGRAAAAVPGRRPRRTSSRPSERWRQP